MRFRGLLSLATLFAVSLSVGCSMTNPTVRGQAPDSTGPIIGSAPGYGDLKQAPYLGRHGHDFKPGAWAHDNNFGYEGGFYAGPNGYYTDRNDPYTNDCNAGCQNGCPNGCQHGFGRNCLYCNGMPKHYQTYQYDWPENMVYPTQGVPAGMVQYPYYTLRGPTDFFMQ